MALLQFWTEDKNLKNIVLVSRKNKAWLIASVSTN